MKNVVDYAGADASFFSNVTRATAHHETVVHNGVVSLQSFDLGMAMPSIVFADSFGLAIA